MKNIKKLRVLVVDDSIVFREVLVRALNEDEGIEVIGTAPNAVAAFKLIEEQKPDVITADIEMPGMDGIEFVRKLMEKHPLPVVMVSSLDARVFEAMAAGAIDFVVKPSAGNMGTAGFLRELIVKLKIASIAKARSTLNMSPVSPSVNEKDTKRLIAIGASTGGTEAILKVLKDLPPNMPGIVIVQHIPPVFSRMFADRVNNLCQLSVKEACDGDEVSRGVVLIAPGDYHMKVAKKSSGYFVRCYNGEKVNGHSPSVDVLFDSVAETAGENAVGVILTGMGRDGAKGLLNMRSKGAYTIGQDEQSSVVYGMPKAAWDIGAVMKQVRLEKVGDTLIERVLR